MSQELLIEMKNFQNTFNGRADKTENEVKGLQAAISRFEAEMLRPDGGRKKSQNSESKLGEFLRKSEDLARHLKNQTGVLRLHVPELFTKAVLTGGSIAPTDRDNQIVGQPARQLRVRDILRVGPPATSSKVDFLKENSYTNAAAPQVEGSSKAESVMTFVGATTDVRTLAHYLNVSTQALDDIPGLQQFLNDRLLYGLKLVEEGQLLTGDGTGVNLLGIIPQATAYATATYNVSGDTKLDKLRHMILQSELTDIPVDAVVLNPRDLHDIELLKDLNGGAANTGSYIAADPLGGALTVKTLWGKPVITSKAITFGNALVGSFGTAAEIRDRQNATIDISFEHANNFAENKATIRAEERLALAVTWPQSFIYGAL